MKPVVRDAKAAFNEAIERGLLSSSEQSPKHCAKTTLNRPLDHRAPKKAVNAR